MNAKERQRGREKKLRETPILLSRLISLVLCQTKGKSGWKVCLNGFSKDLSVLEKKNVKRWHSCRQQLKDDPLLSSLQMCRKLSSHSGTITASVQSKDGTSSTSLHPGLPAYKQREVNTDTLGEDITGRNKVRAIGRESKKLGVVSEPDLAGSLMELESERELNCGPVLRRGLGANLSLAAGSMGSFYSAPPPWTRFRGRNSKIWNDSNPSSSVSPEQRGEVALSCWAPSLTPFATVWWE